MLESRGFAQEDSPDNEDKLVLKKGKSTVTVEMYFQIKYLYIQITCRTK